MRHLPSSARLSLFAALLCVTFALLASGCRPRPADPSGFRSDDFNTCAVDTARWRLEDPRGDSHVRTVGAGSGNARLELEVAPGATHDPWVSNTAPRLLQTIENVDLSLEARFESAVTQGQMQGLVVEESPQRFIRFDTYHDGVTQRLFGAIVWDGVAGTVVNQPIAAAFPLHLRIVRTGNQWTLSHGPDGVTWTQLANFPRAMTATAAGIVAGNFGPSGAAPAHTAVVDYMFSTSWPVAPEDGAAVPATVSLHTVITGPGTVEVDPPGSSFACGTEVTLTAHPDPANELVAWDGALKDNPDNPAQLVLLGNTVVSALFGPDLTPPEIHDVSVATGPTGAVLRWRTDEASSGVVAYGPTPSYELGTVESEGPSFTHEVTLSGLAPLTPYHARIQAIDGGLNAAFSADIPFVTTAGNGSSASGLRSDDFNTCVLDSTVWTAVDPLADASFEIVGAGAGDSALHISVPAGTEHEPGAVNLTARVLQDVADTDFDVAVRFTSDVTERYQEQGLVVEGSAGDYLRADFYSDGIARFLFVAAFTTSGSTTYANLAIPAGGEGLYLRLARAGDQWTPSWSVDGISWIEAASFVRPLSATRVGIFAGNESSGGPAPAHTAIADWFSVLESPAIPEDLLGTIETATLSIATNGPGSVERDPDQSVFGCGESVLLTAIPQPGFAFSGWSGDLSGADNPETVSMTSDRSVTATFVVDTVPPVILDAEVFRTPTGAIAVWETNEPATSLVRYGLTAAYGQQTPLDPTLTKNHLVTIEGLDPGLDYHFQIESRDGAGLVTTSGDLVGPAPVGPTLVIFQGANQSAGANGRPQPMWNLLGNASDADGVQSVTVSVNGGPAQPLSLGPDTFRLDAPGDFNAEIPYSSLNVGSNQILVRATDTLGNPSVAVVTVDLAAPAPPAPDLFIDWSAVSDVQSVASVIDGDWQLEDGALRVADLGYDRLVGIGDLSWTEYEAEIELTFHDYEGVFTSPSNGPALGVIARWPGHTPDGFQPTRRWWPFGAYAAHRWQQSGSGAISESTRMWGDSGLVLASTTGLNLVPGEDYVMKIRVEEVGGNSVYRFKLWPASAPEPATWLLEGAEAGDVASGSLLLVAHHVDVSWRSVLISPLP